MRNRPRTQPSREGWKLLFAFIGQIFVVPRKWYPDERPTFKRPFPDVLFRMFKIWHTKNHNGTSVKYIETLYSDLNIFTRDFEEIMINEYGFGCEQKESRGSYALSRYDFKYRLSKCRFSKLGLMIYASALPDGDSISDNPEYLSELYNEKD
jgi:hypothetical protein